jgi:hypothetical protein
MKPRASYSSVGQYWVVRGVFDGWCVQGIGWLLYDAYVNFLEEWQKHEARTHN